MGHLFVGTWDPSCPSWDIWPIYTRPPQRPDPLPCSPAHYPYPHCPLCLTFGSPAPPCTHTLQVGTGLVSEDFVRTFSYSFSSIQLTLLLLLLLLLKSNLSFSFMPVLLPFLNVSFLSHLCLSLFLSCLLYIFFLIFSQALSMKMAFMAFGFAWHGMAGLW